MSIYGKWYTQGSATQYEANLEIDDDIFHLEIENGITYSGKFERLNIGTRLGNVERKIVLEDGSLFATKDNDAIDKLFKSNFNAKRLIHTLESKIIWVLVAMVVSVIFTFGFFKFAVPFFSKSIAYSLPAKTNQLIAKNALEFLDEYMFKDSELSQEEIQRIRTHFRSKVIPLSEANDKITYKLHFRLYKVGNMSVPNAMALPSGDIILTDKFVQLCQNQEEMDSVLLHEMGHIVHRHTLQTVIESTFISVAVMMALGDTSQLADMGVGLGTLLVSSNYSREHESQADTYAFEHMLVAKIDPIAFANIMDRMTEYVKTSSNYTKEEKETNSLEYISSHPKTEERVKIAKKYSECFKKGLTSCVNN